MTTTASDTTALVREEPPYAAELRALADRVKITIPDLAVEVEVPPDTPPQEVVVGPTSAPMTDLEIVKTYLKAHQGSRPYGAPRISEEQATAAAQRLGPTKLVKIVARQGSKGRAKFARIAFLHHWLPPTFESLEALCQAPADRSLMLSALWSTGETDLETHLSASAITAWLVADVAYSDGLARAMSLWSHHRFPKGMIDHEVITRLGTESVPRNMNGLARTPRLSPMSVRYLVNKDIALTGVAVAFAGDLSDKDLVELYDDVVAYYDSPDDRVAVVAALRPVVEKMHRDGHTSRAVVARCKHFMLTYRTSSWGSPFFDFVLGRARFTDAELLQVLSHQGPFICWLDGNYAKNQPKERLALRIAAKHNMRELLHAAQSQVHNRGPLDHPERYGWLLPLLTDAEGIPAALRYSLRSKHTMPDPFEEVSLQAAAAAFAQASPEVQTRLWRSFASAQSAFDAPSASFTSVTAEFIARSEEAAARVAARAKRQAASA